MKKILTQNCPNIPATEKFAREFFEQFLQHEPHFTIFLEGGLGVGKTFLVQNILQHFNCEGPITSPTYTYVQEYQNPGQKSLAHFDFYRLEAPTDFFSKGFEEIAGNENVCKFVEWPNKIGNLGKSAFSGKQWTIKMEHGVGVGMREIKVLES